MYGNNTSTQTFHKITYNTIILERRAISFWTEVFSLSRRFTCFQIKFCPELQRDTKYNLKRTKKQCYKQLSSLLYYFAIKYHASFYKFSNGLVGWGHPPVQVPTHTGLTRVSSIQFLLFEIKRVLVFNSIIFYFTDLFILYIFLKIYMPTKKHFIKIMFNGSNCDRKSQLSGILTEPLNPRVLGSVDCGRVQSAGQGLCGLVPHF